MRKIDIDIINMAKFNFSISKNEIIIIIIVLAICIWPLFNAISLIKNRNIVNTYGQVSQLRNGEPTFLNYQMDLNMRFPHKNWHANPILLIENQLYQLCYNNSEVASGRIYFLKTTFNSDFTQITNIEMEMTPLIEKNVFNYPYTFSFYFLYYEDDHFWVLQNGKQDNETASNIWNLIEFHPYSGIISNISIDLFTTLDVSLETFEYARFLEPYGFFFHKKSFLIIERFNIYNNENSSNPYLTDSVFAIANFSSIDFQFRSFLTLPSYPELAKISVDQSKINFHVTDDPLGNDPNIKNSIYSFYHNTTDFSKPCQTKQEEYWKSNFIYRGDTVFDSTVHIDGIYGFLNTEQIEIWPLCGYSGNIHKIPVGFLIFYYDEINHDQIIIRREFGLVVSSVILSGSIIWIAYKRIVKKKKDYRKEKPKKIISLRKF